MSGVSSTLAFMGERGFESRWLWVGGVVVICVALVVGMAAGVIGWRLGAASTPELVADQVDRTDQETSPQVERVKTDPLFRGPEDLGRVIAAVRQSTVTVGCAGGTGAGAIIETTAEPKVRPRMRDAFTDEYRQVVVTAEHVIRECKDSPEELSVTIGSTSVPATLMHWDRPADVATIGIASNAPALQPYSFTPGGSWAMTLGAPIDGFLVPLIGEVVHDNGVELLMHMTTRPGNSGGPVVNSRGELVGIVGGTIMDGETESPVGWSYAAPIEVLCEKTFTCTSMGIDARR